MKQLSPDHPSVEQLAAFGLGRLNESESATIEEHLSACGTCCEIVDKAAPDSLVHQLKALPVPAATDCATVPPTGIEAAGAPPTSAGRTPLAEAATLATIAHSPSGPDFIAATEPAFALHGAEIPDELANHSRYRIQELLGTGGMGAVYKAEHRLMQRAVALKVINPKFMQSKQAVERFRREVQAAARLHHPNIVTAHDAEQAGNLHYLVMEYVQGTDLGKVLDQRGPLPIPEACEYIRQAALGLQHAHESGMVHRDIKPQNLMVTRPSRDREGANAASLPHSRGSDRVVKILDFGLASLTSEAAISSEAGSDLQATFDSQKPDLTQAGSIMGTPDYMAPEQGRDAHTADIRSDIYSLGCTLYSLLAGRVPYPGGTAIDKVIAHSANEPQPIRELRPELPVVLVQILAKMMAKDPAERYQTPAEVAAVLASRSVLAPESGRGGRSRSVVRVAIAAVFAGLVMVAGAVFYIATDNGTIEIRTDDENIKVVAERNGKSITLDDFKNKQKWVVDTGAWTVRLDGNPDGLEMEMPNTFTLKRGGHQVVAIRRVKKMPEPLSEKVGEIRRFEGHRDAVWAVAVSPDGRQIISGGGDNASGDCDLRLWDAQTGKELRRLEGHRDGVHTVMFSPDGRRALSGGADRTLRLWDVETGKQLFRGDGHPGVIFSAVLSPDGRQALAGSVDGNKGQLWLWDLATQKVLKKIDVPGQVFSVAFMPDGRRILSGDHIGVVRLWELETGQELKRFEGHSGWVLGLSLSSDAKQFFTSSTDRTARLWDIGTGAERKLFEGHTGAVTRVKISSDGRRILTCSLDRTVRLWEIETGKELRRFDGHTDRINSIDFHSDGRHALSASSDKTVRLWRLPEPAITKTAAAQPFFILDPKGNKDRAFTNLAEAITAAQSRDIIEIRGDGPFVSDSVATDNKALTIRAGKGFQPVLRLSPRGIELHQTLVHSTAPLVLEGLNLQMLGLPASSDKDSQGWRLVHVDNSTLHLANCRLTMKRLNETSDLLHYLVTENCSVFEARNCLLLGEGVFFSPFGITQPKARFLIENCLLKGGADFWARANQLQGVRMSLRSNTFAGWSPCVLFLDPNDPLTEGPCEMEWTGNIIASANNHFGVARFPAENAKPLAATDAEKLLRRSVSLKEKWNVYSLAPGSPFLLWNPEFTGASPRKSLATWEQLWELNDTGSIQTKVRFKNDQALIQKEGLTPDDFRLAKGSPGQGMLPSGKDAGADVDLVGPGMAYEKWKKTPEHRAWLNETGQVETEVRKIKVGPTTTPKEASLTK